MTVSSCWPSTSRRRRASSRRSRTSSGRRSRSGLDMDGSAADEWRARRAARPLLDRRRRGHPRRRPRRHRAGHHGRGRQHDPARGRRHAVTPRRDDHAVTGADRHRPGPRDPGGHRRRDRSTRREPPPHSWSSSTSTGRWRSAHATRPSPHIEPAAQRALRHLARLAAARPRRLVVAVLTGRTVADVAARVRVGGIDVPRRSWPAVGRAAPRRSGRRHRRHDGHRCSSAIATPPRSSPPASTVELGSPSWLFVERKGPVGRLPRSSGRRRPGGPRRRGRGHRDGRGPHGSARPRPAPLPGSIRRGPPAARRGRQARGRRRAHRPPRAGRGRGRSATSSPMSTPSTGSSRPADAGTIEVGVTVAVDGADRPAPAELARQGGPAGSRRRARSGRSSRASRARLEAR